MRKSLLLICAACLSWPALAQQPAEAPVLDSNWSLEKQKAPKAKATQRRSANTAQVAPPPRQRSKQSPRITARASNKGRRDNRANVGVAVPF